LFQSCRCLCAFFVRRFIVCKTLEGQGTVGCMGHHDKESNNVKIYPLTVVVFKLTVLCKYGDT
jgi:hypothetical protein